MHRSIRIAVLPITVAAFTLAVAMANPAAARDLPDRLADVITLLESRGVTVDVEHAYEATLMALLRAVDPLAQVYTPEQEARLIRQREGRVFASGLQIAVTNEKVIVSGIADGARVPPDGIAVGDELLRVGDVDVASMGVYRIECQLASAEDKPVVLVVKDSTGTITTQTLERVEQVLPPLAAKEALPFQLGYLRVNRLAAGAGTDVARHIKDWASEGRYGVILDLRSADGEDVDSVKTIAGLFAPEGTFLLAYRDQDDQDLMVVHADDGGPLGMPVMVLVDGRTAGAAEVLAAVLSDSVRGAMLFGQPTRGDLLVRETVVMADGQLLYLATRKLVTGDGAVYSGATGVRPDVVTARLDGDTSMYRPVRSSRTAVLDEEVQQEQLHYHIRNDVILRRAVDVLLGLKALDIRPDGHLTHPSR